MTVKAAPDCPSDLLAKLLEQFNKLQADVVALKDKYNALVTLVNDMKAEFNAHTHNVTHAACAATSAAYPANTAIKSTSGPSTAVADGVAASVAADQVAKLP